MFLHLFLSLLATGHQKEKTEVESSLESAIATPAVVRPGVKMTDSQKENKMRAQMKMRVVLSPKMALVEISLRSAIARP